MFDKDALQYLSENLAGFQYVLSDDTAEATGIKSRLVCVVSDANIESLERFQERPNRIDTLVAMHSCESFCDYVNRFKNAESTVYLNVDGGCFTAILDHHGPEAPAWRSHQVGFHPKQSLEWEAWSGIHNRKLSQFDLALFIEQMLDTIVVPEPNVMLKAALDFQSKENLVLGSANNLDDGATRFTFTKDNATKSVTFPHRIQLSLPVHENEQKIALDGRVRYRVGGAGDLSFVFSFIRNPRAIVRDALIDLSTIILEKTEGLAHYQGAIR